MTDDWNWEKTLNRCPKCHGFLLFADDPNSDTWEPTGIFRCEKCGFSVDEKTYDFMDGGDWDFDDDWDEGE